MRFTQTHRKRLNAIFLISVLIPILLVAAVLSGFFSQQMRQANATNVQNTLAAVSQNITMSLREIESLGFAPYLYKDIFSMINVFRHGTFEPKNMTWELSELESNYVLTYSKMMFTTSQIVRRVTFVPSSEEKDYVYSIYRTRSGLATEPYQPENHVVASELMAQSEESFRIHLYREQDGTPNYLYCFVLRDFDSSRLLGVLEVVVSGTEILSFLEDVTLGPKQNLFLTTENGEVFYQRNQTEKLLKEITPAFLGDYDTTMIPIEKSPLQIVHITSKQVARQYSLFSLLIAFGIGLTVTFLGLLIYRRESGRVGKDVNAILDTLKEVQYGNFDARVQVDSGGELSFIASEINEMAVHIGHIIQQEYLAIIGRQKAEYQALQSQINPHLLYNTLNDFIALNRMGETEILEQSIFQLTELLRYLATPKDIVSLKEELEISAHYLKLRKLHLEDRLHFTIDIPKKAYGIKIPKLILQPLVENSIIHGMGLGTSPLTVHIKAMFSEDGQRLILVVQDDGQGFSVHQLKDDSKESLGLNNVRNRLRLFDEESSFAIESTPNKGTCCQIIVPVEGEGYEGFNR